METVRIQNGQTERVEILALDADGNPATGLTDVLLSIRRWYNNQWQWKDFADNTFKSSGWTTRQIVMTEVSASLEPGVYYYNFDTTGFPDSDYEFWVESNTAANLPGRGELKTGGYVDNLDAAISDVKLKTDNLPADTNAALKIIQALCGKNSRMFNATYDSNKNLLSATIRGYAAKADLEADQNQIVELTVAATYSGQGEATTHIMKDAV